jgi:hypothetical protein
MKILDEQFFSSKLQNFKFSSQIFQKEHFEKKFVLIFQKNIRY